jgi:hypothetical protein
MTREFGTHGGTTLVFWSKPIPFTVHAFARGPRSWHEDGVGKTALGIGNRKTVFRKQRSEDGVRKNGFDLGSGESSVSRLRHG